MRGALLVVALAALAAACSLFPPPGSRPLLAEVTNTAAVPVQLTIQTPTGVIQGAVQPASLPARGTGTITFFMPPGDDWWVMVNGSHMFPASDLNSLAAGGCTGKVGMEVNPDGSGGFGCSN